MQSPTACCGEQTANELPVQSCWVYRLEMGHLTAMNLAGPFRCTHCDSATFVLGQFIHYFATQPRALGHDTGNFLHVQMHFNFSFAQDSNADHL